MKIADLDQDGMDDVVVADHKDGTRKILYFRRTDDDGLSWQQYNIDFPSWAGGPKAVAIGDIDKDGQQDIVFTCENADGLYGVGWLSYVNDATDTNWTWNDISGDELGIKYDRIELLDLDGDTDLDVLTCEEREGNGGLGVIWYENPCE